MSTAKRAAGVAQKMAHSLGSTSSTTAPAKTARKRAAAAKKKRASRS
jgi:hypothetical protein